METTELTLGQRLAADTPVFFKKAELVGTAIAAAGGSLTQVQGLPAWIVPMLLGIGASIMLLSKFAVKDTSVLANPNATIADYSAVLADIPNQVDQLEQGITNTTEAIKTGQVPVAQPPAATPIVDVPVIAPLDPQAGSNNQALQGIATLVANGNIPTPALTNPNVSPLN